MIAAEKFPAESRKRLPGLDAARGWLLILMTLSQAIIESPEKAPFAQPK